MKAIKALAAAAVLVAGATLSAPAFAWDHHHGGRAHFGISIGIPVYGPGWYAPYSPYYYPPYYYPPVVVAQPATPPVYVEKDSPAQQAAPESWWYYCAGSKAYYPYVRECPGGWQRVSPTPPR